MTIIFERLIEDGRWTGTHIENRDRREVRCFQCAVRETMRGNNPPINAVIVDRGGELCCDCNQVIPRQPIARNKQ